MNAGATVRAVALVAGAVFSLGTAQAESGLVVRTTS